MVVLLLTAALWSVEEVGRLQAALTFLPPVMLLPRALELALEVYQRVPSAESIETLAMAYAQAGRFEEAVAWQEQLLTKAQAAGDPEIVARVEGNLERYRARRVCCVGEE